MLLPNLAFVESTKLLVRGSHNVEQTRVSSQLKLDVFALNQGMFLRAVRSIGHLASSADILVTQILGLGAL
jgi:hypothetical protein